ncbi:hypothetical protein C8034_v004666 [Colletotrichum sidae]|uniref:Uncharacterized protein n=2 Tax=Colletotrichum orbiculare species complex TaxID=2707354 RepID=A0A4R8RM80_COLTR|nr:hypothetical protein CTRI78_v002340 [Colletotrichum trifolii]TEA13718.1 hypothetical protein C8034_v004666 [Colletotrichum sidae]
MRQSLLFAVAALTTLAQGAAVEKREAIEKRQANINIEGINAGAIEVTTVPANQIPGLAAGGGGGGGNGIGGGILAGILEALNGGNKGNSGYGNSGHRLKNSGHQNTNTNKNKGHQNTNNNNNYGNHNNLGNNICNMTMPPPVTITKTVCYNATAPAPLTVFVTQAAPPPIIIYMSAPPPAAPAAPPAVPPAAPAAPPAMATPASPPPIAAEPPAAQPPPAVSQPPAALPFVGNPAAGGTPTTSLNLGGLPGNGNPADPAAVAQITPPAVANNPGAQPNVNVGGLSLNKSLQLGNLLQQTIGLQARARETPQAEA